MREPSHILPLHSTEIEVTFAALGVGGWAIITVILGRLQFDLISLFLCFYIWAGYIDFNRRLRTAMVLAG